MILINWIYREVSLKSKETTDETKNQVGVLIRQADELRSKRSKKRESGYDNGLGLRQDSSFTVIEAEVSSLTNQSFPWWKRPTPFRTGLKRELRQ